MQHYYGACGWGTVRFDAGIHCVQYGPAGDVVAASDSDGRIHFICAQTGEALVCPLSGHRYGVNSVCWNNDGTKLASGSDDKTVKVWDPTTGECLWTLTGHQSLVSSVHFSPDGTRLVTGSYDKTVKFWNPETGEELCQLRGHSGVVRSVCFSSDGKKLTSGSSADMTARNWNPATRASLS